LPGLMVSEATRGPLRPGSAKGTRTVGKGEACRPAGTMEIDKGGEVKACLLDYSAVSNAVGKCKKGLVWKPDPLVARADEVIE